MGRILWYTGFGPDDPKPYAGTLLEHIPYIADGDDDWKEFAPQDQDEEGDSS